MSPPDVLVRIVADTRRRLAEQPPDRAALERAAAALGPAPDGLASLFAPGVRVIAEVKRRSPSAGDIAAAVDPVAQATTYSLHGAAAISVLTEPDHFGGSLDDLRRVAAAVETPCLRKDFIVHADQLLEARVAGASLVLLIAAVLDDLQLRTLREDAEALGLHALVEAHDEDEVRRSVDSGARVVGVNNRDLRDFRIDLSTSERLRPLIPQGVVAVAESGIHTPADLQRLRRAGYDVFLVGTGLMRAADPAAALRALVEVGATLET